MRRHTIHHASAPEKAVIMAANLIALVAAGLAGGLTPPHL